MCLKGNSLSTVTALLKNQQFTCIIRLTTKSTFIFFFSFIFLPEHFLPLKNLHLLVCMRVCACACVLSGRRLCEPRVAILPALLSRF